MVNQKFKAQSFHGFNDQTNQQNINQHDQQLDPIQQFQDYRHISLPNFNMTSQSVPRLVRASSLNIDHEGGEGGNQQLQQLNKPKSEHDIKFLNVKVTIEFQGDINTMTMNWTPKEIENSRRLVLITFKQQFSHLILNFKPIDQNDYIPGTPVISCIYWNQTNKFYVTSVDLITLLEYLVNAKFPVEEKNRIRRNLKSLKPLTISKSNPKFYQFFQLIMNFQNPKPRHIEKDVKVLLWDSLGDSLKKVLSKYTIDPTIDYERTGSSSSIPTTSSSLGTGTISSSSSKDHGYSQYPLPQVNENATNYTVPYNYQYQNLPPPISGVPPSHPFQQQQQQQQPQTPQLQQQQQIPPHSQQFIQHQPQPQHIQQFHHPALPNLNSYQLAPGDPQQQQHHGYEQFQQMQSPQQQQQQQHHHHLQNMQINQSPQQAAQQQQQQQHQLQQQGQQQGYSNMYYYQ